MLEFNLLLVYWQEGHLHKTLDTNFTLRKFLGTPSVD